MKAIAVLLLALALLAAPIAAQTAVCNECLKVVAWLENELTSNSTLGELESALQTVCSLMPAPEQSTCQNIVSKYLPDAINWILSRASPTDACTAIHLCSSSAVGAPTSPPTPPPNPSDVCKICELAAAGAELYIDAHPNDTASEVLAELNKVCNISLLEKYKFECELLISSEGGAIVNALFAGKPASQVCSSTVPPLCPSAARAVEAVGKGKPFRGMGKARGMGRTMGKMHKN